MDMILKSIIGSPSNSNIFSVLGLC